MNLRFIIAMIGIVIAETSQAYRHTEPLGEVSILANRKSKANQSAIRLIRFWVIDLIICLNSLDLDTSLRSV